MKNQVITSILVVLILMSISACASSNKSKDKKNKIVATLFPQYDFVKEIVKIKERLLLCLRSGAHSFEPTPQDIRSIRNADIFLYTGKYGTLGRKMIKHRRRGYYSCRFK